jgi:hypothetical protein
LSHKREHVLDGVFQGEGADLGSADLF